MIKERTGLIIWISDTKVVRHLERFGNIHYTSKKMHYVVLYTDADLIEQTTKQLLRHPHVKKIERSYRNEIRTEYSNTIPDKTRFYTL